MPSKLSRQHFLLLAAAACTAGLGCESTNTPSSDAPIENASPDALPSAAGDAANVDGSSTPDALPQLGMNDATAAQGCAALEGSGALLPTTVTASLSQADAEATQAKVAVDGSKVFLIELPQGKEGWVSLDQGTWDATIAFFIAGNTPYEIKHAEAEPQTNAPRINAACPASNLTDYRVFFHHWTTASLRFGPTGPRQVKLFAVKVPT